MKRKSLALLLTATLVLTNVTPATVLAASQTETVPAEETTATSDEATTEPSAESDEAATEPSAESDEAATEPSAESDEATTEPSAESDEATTEPSAESVEIIAEASVESVETTTEPSASSIQNGLCLLNENIAYSYDDTTKTLTITSRSEYESIPDNYSWSDEQFGWEDYAETAENLVIEAGIITIGNSAFTNFVGLKNVSLPEGVYSIGEYSFDGCTSLISINLPESLTTIKESAFDDCTSLSSITLPKGLKTIEGYTFRNCYGLSSITLPEGLTTIERYAFCGCSGLGSITLPKGLTTIKDYAFYECSGLSNITLPEGLTKIGEEAFYGCSSLGSITLPKGLTTIENFAFWNCSGLGSVTLPEGLTKISEGTFYGCSSLDSITLPEGLTTIARNAFRDCSLLSSVTLPESLTTIGDYAFAGTAVKKVVCPSDHLTIPRLSFPEDTEVVYTNPVFSGVCPADENITFAFERTTFTLTISTSKEGTEIPSWSSDNNITFGWEAYAGSAESLVIESGITAVGDFAFYGFSKLTDISLPEGLTAINKKGFCGCSSLTGISLPETLTVIGVSAFDNCTNLSSVTLPKGLTTIGDDAFVNCRKLSSIILPEGLTSVGAHAFFSTAIRKVTCLSPNLSIGDDIFPGGTTITYAEPYISDVCPMDENIHYTFDYTTKILTVTSLDGEREIPETYSSYSDKLGWEDFADVAETLVIGTGITKISSNAFRFFNQLKSVSLPEGLAAISSYAFYACPKLSDISLPESLTSIGDYSFRECSSLSSISLPKNLKAMGYSAFMDSGVKKVTCLSDYLVNLEEKFPEDAEIVYANPVISDVCLQDENILYSYDRETKTLTVTSLSGEREIPENNQWNDDKLGWRKYENVTKKIVIESGITAIGDYAFCHFDYLDSVVLPDTLQKIGFDAFNRNSSISKVECPSNQVALPRNTFSSNTEIIYAEPTISSTCLLDENILFTYDRTTYTLTISTLKEGTAIPDKLIEDEKDEYGSPKYGPSGLEMYAKAAENLVVETGITAIGEATCKSFKALINVSLPEGLTAIGTHAFSECSSLYSVSLPDTLTSIGDRAFYHCYDLSDISLPKNLTTIGSCAFYNCDSFGNFSLPDTITSVGENAFAYTAGQDSLVLPENLKELGYGAFNSSSIKHVDCLSNYLIRPEIAFSSDTEIVYAEPCISDVCLLDERIGYTYNRATSVLTIKSLSGEADIPNRENTNEDTLGWEKFTYLAKELVIEPGITSIGDYAFTEFIINSLSLPDGLTTIGNSAFTGCRSLSSIRFPEKGLTTIEDYAFRGCWSIDSIELHEGLTTIGYSAFSDCKSLISVSLPEGLTTLSSGIFQYCSALTSVNLPKSLTTIEYNAFYKCDSLHSISLPENVRELSNGSFHDTGIRYVECLSNYLIGLEEHFSENTEIVYAEPAITGECLMDSNIIYSYNRVTRTLTVSSLTEGAKIPDRKEYSSGDYAYSSKLDQARGGVVIYYDDLGWELFADYTIELVIKPGIIAVGDRAFMSFYKLGSVSLPDGMLTIGEKSFYSCLQLSSVNLPESLLSVGKMAFYITAIKHVVCQTAGLELGENAFPESTQIDRPDAIFLQEDAVTLSETEYTYDGKQKTPTITVKDGNTVLKEDTDYTVTYTSDRTSAGTHTVTVQMKRNYGGIITKTFTIRPKALTAAAVTLKTASYTYDGKQKTPAVTVKDGSIVLTPSTDYIVSYAAGRTNAGTYKVTVQMMGNYTGKFEKTFKISAKKLTAAAVTLKTASYTYDGKQKTPAVTVKNGTTVLKKGTDYTVTFAAGRKNVGTYKVTVQMKGNYTGKFEKTFKISAKKLTATAVTLKAASYVYDGKLKTPAVTVKNGTTVLKKGTDYTVTYAAGRKNVGTYKVTVQMKGNYTGKIEKTFAINPKGTTLSTVTAQKKGFKATVKKQAAQTTGYQVQYATNNKFTGAVTKTIGKNTTTSLTVSSLKGGQKYFVRVRTYKTVNGKTYYSAWSAAKNVTTKK